VHCEWVVSSPGMIKGWGMHMESDDRYVVGAGRLRVVLHDGRVDSPSYGDSPSSISGAIAGMLADTSRCLARESELRRG
jgi:dTDP-4-dehydrorhamnose 3,5-epimerase-like enzyme